MASTWIVLLLAAAATAAAAVATNTLLDSRRLPAMMSYGGGAFVSSPSTQLELLCKSVGTSHVPRFHNTFHRSLLSTVPSMQLAMSQSPSTHSILQQQIVQGAALKLLQTKNSSSSSSIYTTTSRVTKDAPRDTKSIPKGQYTYYIREGQRSGE